MRILYLEDDMKLFSIVSNSLSKYMIVDSSSSIKYTKELLDFHTYDFLLLGQNSDGLDVTLALIPFVKKQSLNTYIILLSNYNSLEEKLIGLDLGANDCLEKPFHLEELHARMKAISRQNSQPIFEHLGLICDVNEKRLFFKDKEIFLTLKETQLLFYLIMHRQKIVSHQQLLSALYRHPENVISNTLHVTITHIRKKLPVNFIRTIKTRGYTIYDSFS